MGSAGFNAVMSQVVDHFFWINEVSSFMPWSSAKSPQQQTSQLTQAGWEKPPKIPCSVTSHIARVWCVAKNLPCSWMYELSFLFFFGLTYSSSSCQIRISLTFNDQDLEKWGRRDEKMTDLGEIWWVWTSHRESYHGCSPGWLEILPTACPGKYRHFTCHKVVQMGILPQWPSKSWNKCFFGANQEAKQAGFLFTASWVELTYDWDLWNQNSVVKAGFPVFFINGTGFYC